MSNSGATSLARASRGIAGGTVGPLGGGRIRFGNAVFGVSVLHDQRHPSQKIVPVGAGFKRFLLGIWIYAELEGARGMYRVQFKVAETMEQVFVQ